MQVWDKSIFLNTESSVENLTSSYLMLQLGEAGMAERRREQRQREALVQKRREYPQRKLKGRDIGW